MAGKEAPHKPLLILYAIGKLLRGEDRLISYTDDIEENLENLLREFGPRRDNYNPHFPVLAIAKRRNLGGIQCRQNRSNT